MLSLDSKDTLALCGPSGAHSDAHVHGYLAIAKQPCMIMLRTFTLLLLLTQLLPSRAQTPRLFGMTPMGGANNKGTIFRIDGDGSDFVVMHHFDDASGWAPEGTLCAAPNGMLYGTTNLGGTGAIAAGTLFKIDPGSGAFTKLIDFDMNNGGFCWSGMVVGPDGKLYGASYAGGSGGSIFKLDPSDDSYSILRLLNQSTDGGGVNNLLTFDSNGLIYGACNLGGANSAGTLFRYDPVNDVYTKLHDFDGAANGKTPYGRLCLASDGWLYGTTFSGGSSNQGIFFKLNPADQTFVKIFDFTGTNGQSPWNGPLEVAPDLLYGSITSGGAGGSGLIYRYVPSTSTWTTAHAFGFAESGTHFGNLCIGIDGRMYGMGASGGTNFQGSIYSFNPTNNGVTILHSFLDATDGYSPRGDLIPYGLATGIDEADRSPRFMLSPNPAPGNSTLSWAEPLKASASVRIADATGRLLHEQLLVAGTERVELSANPGLHFVSVIAAGKASTLKWSVQ